MNGSTRRVLRVGWQVATEHPSLILWYLRNRLRGALLPLERAFANGYSLAPRFITLKPTLRCNLRCEFCRFVANGDVFGKRDWLEIEDWERIIDEIAPFQPYVCITGGEPTMYPPIARLIARIKSHGLTCVMTTNGTMLDARAEELIENPPDILILSIDGPREVHDQVRMVDGTYDRAFKGIQTLHRFKRERGRHTPYLILNSAITGRTYENTVRMLEVAREFGALAINFQHFWFMTRPMVDEHNRLYGDCFPLDFQKLGGTDTTGVPADELYDTIQRVRREDHGLPVNVFPELDRDAMRTYYEEPAAFTHRMTPSCAWISTDILPNGDVSPCFDLVVGNVLREPFLDAWNSPSFRAHRSRLSRHGPYPVCARCCAYFRND
jgi:MoaA/NifB/PqqE/SkfB family radical SAM enzyme